MDTAGTSLTCSRAPSSEFLDALGKVVPLAFCGERGLIGNRRIPEAEPIEALASFAKIFRRGDIVKTAEGRKAEVVTLFATGKVGIRFLSLSSQSSAQRTARIPETLTLVERSKPMQLISVPLPP